MSTAKIIPGNFKLLRQIVRMVLIAIFLAVPWISYNGRPAILLDPFGGRFYFPGFVIWNYEIYYLIFLFFLFVGFLYLFTITFGRVWCGWGCPQAIYVEVFKDIGKLLFPDDFGKRSQKSWQTVIIHSIWILLSAFFIFHFMGYFVPIREMTHESTTLAFSELFSHSWPFFFLALTALFYSDIGVFREQFCVHMCPYSRFQSLMFDKDSLVIGYDGRRGEPRKRTRMNILPAGPLDMGRSEGDCTSCNMCTMTCPTGIDIREGLQIACINCTSCIDACTVEMGRFGKRTLIEYGSIRWFETNQKGHFIRGRTLFLTSGLILATAVFAYLLYARVPTRFDVHRNQDLPVRVGEHSLDNFYVLNVSNVTESEVTYGISLNLLEGMEDFNSIEAGTDVSSFTVGPNQKKQIHLVVTGVPVADRPPVARDYKLLFYLKDLNNPENRKEATASFTLPGVSNE